MMSQQKRDSSVPPRQSSVMTKHVLCAIAEEYPAFCFVLLLLCSQIIQNMTPSGWSADVTVV
jgi:hypothetical protein